MISAPHEARILLHLNSKPLDQPGPRADLCVLSNLYPNANLRSLLLPHVAHFDFQGRQKLTATSVLMGYRMILSFKGSFSLTIRQNCFVRLTNSTPGSMTLELSH
jgi:hypothetical protein